MSIAVALISRAFRYNGTPLPDPDPSMSVEQVKAFYSPAYPELTSSLTEGPTDEGGVLTYSFSRAVGTKGGTCKRRD
jgi:PRTRC genetic system protein C